MAPRELLLRVPGLGVESVGKLLQARRLRRIRADDLRQMKLPIRKLLPFVVADGHRPRSEVGDHLLARPGASLLDAAASASPAIPPVQMGLF